jgi:hypothetical protein
MAHEGIIRAIESSVFKLFIVFKEVYKKKRVNYFQLTLLLSPRGYLRENARLQGNFS